MQAMPVTFQPGDVLPRIRLHTRQGREADSWALRQRRSLLILRAGPGACGPDLLEALAESAVELEWLEVSVWVLAEPETVPPAALPERWEVSRDGNAGLAVSGEALRLPAALLADRYGAVYAVWPADGGDGPEPGDILDTVRLMNAECPECGGRLWQDLPGP